MKRLLFLFLLLPFIFCAGPVQRGHLAVIAGSTVASGSPPAVTELTLRDTETATASSSTTIQISVPTNSNGDLLVLSVVNDDGNSFSTPSGWDSEGSISSGSSTHAIFSRTASSEPANYTITNGGSTSMVAVMTCWQKPSGTWVTDPAFQDRASSHIVATPAMTPVDDCVLYFAYPNDAAYTIIDGPDIGSGLGVEATSGPG